MKRRIMGFFLAVVIFITASLSFGGAAGQVNASPAEGMERYWVNFYRYDKDGYKEMKVMASCMTSNTEPISVKKDGSTEYVNVNVEEIVSKYSIGDGYTVTGFICNGKYYDYPATKSIKLYEKDFKTSSSGTTKDIDITFTRNNHTNCWLDGRWYDGNGKNSYKATGSWKHDGTGYWYEDSSGWYPVDKWQKIDGQWFYFKSNGYAAETGWHQIGGNWYYLWTALGSESTSTSYDENGKVTSTTTKTEYWGGYSSKCWVDGYWIGADGICSYPYTGAWKSDGNGWWFEDKSGWYPSSQWQQIDGKWYYFKADGYLATSQYVDGCWVGSDGAWDWN